MRIKVWGVAAVAILGMVNTASAHIVYSISETALSGSLTGSAGSSVTVGLYLNENVNKGTSIINSQGILNYALGVNYTSTTGTASTITAVTPSTFSPSTTTYTVATNNG